MTRRSFLNFISTPKGETLIVIQAKRSFGAAMLNMAGSFLMLSPGAFPRNSKGI